MQLKSQSIMLLALAIASTGLQAQVETEPKARYKLTFEADWSAETHPISFPPNPHFSPLIGATHNSNGYFWRIDENSSDGVEDMAETGSIVILRNEINDLISQDSARFLIEGAGVPLSPGVTSVEFDVARSHPLLSVTTMIAPSPDWFVGVDSLPLLENGSWVDGLTVELYSVDAGTDDGIGYTSSNRNTSPAQPIALIGDGPAVNDLPIGRFVLELLSVEGQLPIEGAHSGLYFDPLRDGEGININIDMIGDRHVLTAIWYTHHEGRQMWLIGVVDLEPNATEVTLDLLIAEGASFGDAFNSMDVDFRNFGTATIRFPDCNAAIVDYDGGQEFGMGQLTLERLIGVDGLACQ